MKIRTVMAVAILGVSVAAFGRNNTGVARGSGAATTTTTTTGITSNTIIVNDTTVSTNGLGFATTTGAVTTTTTTTGATGAAATTGLGTTPRSFDQQFLNRATIDSQQEILLGSVAQTNSQNPDIQAFGQQLVTDHTAAIEQAQAVAATLGITLPNRGGNLGIPRGLLNATGTRFDQQFIAFMIQSHIQDINLFEMGALRGRNADVRAFARGQLPVLMNHLVTALEIRENLATGTITGTGAGTNIETNTNTVTNTNTATNTDTGTDP